jgi:3-oxoacyl-[acyl-carrier-protein] synthase III
MTRGSVREAFITAAGAFLPGEAIPNDAMEEKLGYVGGKPSRYRQRILRSNGIASRHYAIDEHGNQSHLNEEIAANAVNRALESRGLRADQVGMLAMGTTIPDVQMPGFSTMVHGRIGGGTMECLSAGGVCASGVAALRAAVNAVRVGDHDVAVVGGSELVSPMLRGHRFEQESEAAPERENTAGSYQYFNADFLRWMLSDGAGAFVVESKPREDALSLKIEWIELSSYANKYDTCMYFGLSDPSAPAVGKTMFGYKTYGEAERDGLMLIRQDTKLLQTGITDIVGAEAKKLLDRGMIVPEQIDWFLPHLSSYFFRGTLETGLAAVGVNLPESKWFTNLKTRGNTGSASFFIMIEEAMSLGLFKPGQKVLAMIPESGRFSVAYALFTVVGPETSN